MHDDFDPAVADRFKDLDQVPVPDTWSRVLERVPAPDAWFRIPSDEEMVTMIDFETPLQNEPRRTGPMRVLVAGLLAAAALVAIVLMAVRDDDRLNRADEPAATVPVATLDDDAVIPADEPAPTVPVATLDDDAVIPADEPAPTVTVPFTTAPQEPERLNALPPQGATPSSPESGVLLPGLPAVPVFVYEDGRVIWSDWIAGERSRDWFERRLTPEGLEFVRAEIRTGGHLDPATPQVQYRWWRFVDGDREFFTDEAAPDLSWITGPAWADSEPRRFVPSSYEVCLGSPERDPAALVELLPAAAAEPLAGVARREPPPYAGFNLACFDLATNDAREVAVALDASDASHPGPFSYIIGPPNLEPSSPMAVGFTAYLPHGNAVLVSGVA